MASPFVAGAAALYLQWYPTATPAQVMDAVLSSATLNKISDAKGSPNRLLYMRFSQPAVEPTPTATSTPTPTAEPAPTAEPTLTPTPTDEPPAEPAPTEPEPVVCSEGLVNGNFEAGSTAWVESSRRGLKIICANGACGSNPAPADGTWLAWLGGANNETASLTQNISLPAGQSATLKYQYRIDSTSACSNDTAFVRVRVGGKDYSLRRQVLCRSTATGAWQQDTISLDNYAGNNVRLEFYLRTDSSGPSSFFVDTSSIQICTNTGALQAAGAKPLVMYDDMESELLPDPYATDQPELVGDGLDQPGLFPRQ
jgi:hypothetical protein